MHPILFHFGPITLYTYGLALASAFLLATWRVSRALEYWPVRPVPMAQYQAMNLCAFVMIGGVVGARAFFVIQHWEVFWLYPLESIAIWHGGLVWYGGLIGGLSAGEWYLGRHRLSRLRSLDLLVPFVALGHAVGRIGCFLNGCCHGKETAAWFGVTFPGNSYAVVPTQLIESAFLFVLFVFLRWLQRPSVLRHPGRLLGVYILMYAVFRFVLEFWRGDQQFYIGSWTLQQVISVFLALSAMGALVLEYTKRPS